MDSLHENVIKVAKVSPFLKKCFVTATVCLNTVGISAMNGYPAVLLPQLDQPDAPFHLTEDQKSWITSVVAISMVVGNFMATSLMDRFGRRAAHITASIPGIVGWLVTVLANGFPVLLFGRILTGFCFGLFVPLRAVLLGEYTSPANRGAFLTVMTMSQAFGIFFVHLIGSITSWQRTALICAFFHFTSCVMTLYCPESPSYLASKGRFDECRTVFKWLRGEKENDELNELIEARIILNEEEQVHSMKDMWLILRKREFYKPINLMVHAQAMVQFSGAPTMAAFSPIILGLLIGPSVDANFWMIALDGQRIILNFAAIFVINRCKRRIMMLSTGALCLFSQLAMAGYIYAKKTGVLASDLAWPGIVLINLQVVSLAVGMIPMPNVIAGEVFPLQYRGIGSSASIISGAATSFFVLQTFSTLLSSIGLDGTYLLYSIIIFYFLLVMWLLLPETKGKTLQQIEDEFRGRPLKSEEAEIRRPLQLDPRKMSVASVHSMVFT